MIRSICFINKFCWCHNPNFTYRIFVGVSTQNEVAWTEPSWLERGPVALKGSQNIAESTFLEVWEDLTNVDQVWPELIGVDWVWSKFDQDHDRAKSKIWLTTLWPLNRAYQKLRFDTLRVKNEKKKKRMRKLWTKP